MKKRRSVLIELQLEDLKILMGGDIRQLLSVREHCFCTTCGASRPLADGYAVYLDTLNDVILVGNCTVCGSTIQRHLELRENKETSAVANHLRYIKKYYKNS